MRTIDDLTLQERKRCNLVIGERGPGWMRCHLYPDWGYGYFISSKTINNLFSDEMIQFIADTKGNVFLEVQDMVLKTIQKEGQRGTSN